MPVGRFWGGELSYSFVMLNLFQHPWPDLQSRAAPKETAGPWTLKQVQGDEIRNVVFRPLAVIPRKEKARAEARASPPWQAGRSSEGPPILFLAKFHIADVGAEPRADAADRTDGVEGKSVSVRVELGGSRH